MPARYELALKCSGAVQAARWSRTADGGGQRDGSGAVLDQGGDT